MKPKLLVNKTETLNHFNVGGLVAEKVIKYIMLGIKLLVRF